MTQNKMYDIVLEMSETETVKAILTFLKICGIVAWRQNTGGRGRFRWGFPGCGDITGIMPDGRRLEIEVKTGEGKQSDEQLRFQNVIEKNNGVYILARSVADVARVI